MSVQLDVEKRTLLVPDLGVTLRTLLGVAARGYDLSGERQWGVSYKGVRIAQVKVKPHERKQS